MKTAGYLLPLLIVVALPAAEQTNPPATEPAAQPATQAVAQPVAAPAAQPAAAPAAPVAVESPAKSAPDTVVALTEKVMANGTTLTTGPDATKPDPDLLELPKVTIKQKKRPRLTDEVMMTNKAFNEKLAKDKLSTFDRSFLNRFTLPGWFGGVSAAERAREDYDRDKKGQLTKDVLDLAKVTEVVDPAQAKALRDAINKP